MLQWLRDNLKSFAWTLWLVIIAFIVLYIPDFINQGGPTGAVAATLGDQQVTTNEFSRAYRQREEQLRRSLGEQYTPELARQLRLPIQVLDGLINQKILVAEARRLGLQVSDEQVQKEILSFGVFTDEQGRFIGDERYAQMLRRLGYESPGAFEQAVREDLLVGKLQSALAENLYLPDAAIEESYRKQVERASIRWLRLSPAAVGEEVQVTPDELAAYYEERREEYRKPEQRVVTYLLVDTNRLRASLEVPEEELMTYYQDHPDEFTQEEQVRARHVLVRVDDARTEEQARQRIAEARRRIEGGEDFATVAAEMSDDPGSKDRGGDLGFFGRGSMVPEFEEAAFGAEVGDLVGPISTSFGLHLLEVTGRREGGLRPFEEVRGQILFRLQSERAQDEAEAEAQELAGRITAEQIDSAEGLQQLAEGRDELVVDTTPPFGSEDPIARLGRAPELNQAAFELTVGQMTAPVKVPRGWAIARLDEVLPPAVPELSEIEPRVRQALLQQKRRERALERLTEARQAMDEGESLDQVAEELGVEVTESGEFGHGQAVPGLGQVSAVAEAALTMEEGAVGGPVESPQGPVLFQVASRTTFDPARFAEEKDSARSQAEQEELQRVLGALVAERRREVNPTYSRELLANFDMAGEVS